MKKLMMLAVLLIAIGCDRRTAGMEVRTFELHRLNNEDAVSLITPYIREGGLVSGKNRLVTVREKPDRLKVIEELLRKYDGMGEAVDVVLSIQIIEANGFTTRDTAIADIEQTLRQTFKYQGYRLVGETRVQAREGTAFRTTIPSYIIEGEVDRVGSAGSEQRIPVEVRLQGVPAPGTRIEMAGTVTATIGKPTVLGQSTKAGAIILVIRPSVMTP